MSRGGVDDLLEHLPLFAYWFGLKPDEVFDMTWRVLDVFIQALHGLPPVGSVWAYQPPRR